MGKAYKTIQVNQDRCTGCGLCTKACIAAKGIEDLGQSRIRVEVPKKGKGIPSVCLQCAYPECVAVCPEGALKKNPETGIVELDRERCTVCGKCIEACPYGGIFLDPVEETVVKCDQCGGDPACVKACHQKALIFREESEIYNRVGDWEDLFVANSCCQGCNLEIVMRHILRRMGPNTIVAAPPGCVPGVGTVGVNGLTCTKVPSFHPLLTNTASMLAGIKRHYKHIGRDDVIALGLAGDGGAADVGFQSLSGAAERGEQIIFVCIDNEGYANTGMQRAGTTPFGSWTSTTPVGTKLRGKTRDQKYLPLIMAMHRCEYVATACVAYLEDFYHKLDRALEAEKRGMAYLHVFSPCVTGWRFDPSQTIEVQRKAVETNVFPLWEYDDNVGHIKFTHKMKRVLLVEKYLSMLGKYRHLNKEEIAYIQGLVNKRMQILNALTMEEEKAHIRA